MMDDKNNIKRQSVYWKAELIGKALVKVLKILATIGYVWLGLSIFILMNTR